MNIEIINQPIQFQLYGLSADVAGRPYGQVGVGLMDQLRSVVKSAKLGTRGLNHWVYFADDRMFVGEQLKNSSQGDISGTLEPVAFTLNRCAKHIHVGPYDQLPQRWRSLKAELSARGETVMMPSLEVYDHSHQCEDDSEPLTTILLGLK